MPDETNERALLESKLDDVLQRQHELIAELRRERALAYLLISHNLAVVEQLCERVAVLYRGHLVEEGPTPQLLDRPAHPVLRPGPCVHSDR